MARPPGKGEWELRHTSRSTEGWEALCKQAPGPAGVAYDALTRAPLAVSPRQHKLKGSLGSAGLGDRIYDQWQYEVTGGARIWYCPDEDRRIVHLMLVSVGHPKKTE